jgi:hypothetical protein
LQVLHEYLHDLAPDAIDRALDDLHAEGSSTSTANGCACRRARAT